MPGGRPSLDSSQAKMLLTRRSLRIDAVLIKKIVSNFVQSDDYLQG
jgi:hypothetical protein